MQNNILEVPLAEHGVYMYMIPIRTSLLAYFKKTPKIEKTVSSIPSGRISTIFFQ